MGAALDRPLFMRKIPGFEEACSSTATFLLSFSPKANGDRWPAEIHQDGVVLENPCVGPVR